MTVQRFILKGTQNMSYIHHYNDNYYRPSESLRELLEFHIIQPFRDAKPDVVLLFDQPKPDYVTIGKLLKNILGRGSTNFDVQSTYEGFGNFTPKEKVLFYCANYMTMHLSGSYHIYSKYLMQHKQVSESNHIIFIDYGCGPLTSGIAFWNAVGQRNITYIGVDIARSMLNKASEINRNSPVGNSSPYFKNITLSQNYEIVPELLSVVEKDSPSDTVIVFNFCYVLAPITFIGDIRSFIDSIHNAVQTSTDNKICMVYQNPSKLANAHLHWSNLQNEVMNYRYFPIQTFVSHGEDVSYRYEVLMTGRMSQVIDVRYDMLYNW